ncbi:MAG TPA: hypothetical protein VGI39_44465 [Polyangiaceae bacterium]|jgi:hypothetical protein
MVGTSVALCVALVSSGAAHADSKPTKAQCVAANESGQDLHRIGKLREAKAAFASCLAASCPSAVREDCAERLAEVERALPSVVLGATDAASGKDLEEVHVTVDGEPLADVLDGKAAALDPGEHRFRFEASGLPPKEETIVLSEGEKTRRVHVVLGNAPIAAVAPPSPASPPSNAGASAQRAVGLGLLAGGAVAAGAGVVLGLLAKNTQDSALGRCRNGDPNDCPPQALDDSSSAHAEATASTVTFIAAGALLVGGLIVYLSAPGAPDRPTVGFAVGDRSFALRGTW